MKCFNCHEELPEGALFCGYCGSRIEVEKERGPASGPAQSFAKARQPETDTSGLTRPQPDNASGNDFTDQGTNGADGAAAGKPRRKWTAFLLCLFFGFYGVHKFYEGKPGMGILYLFTLGLFGIGWIVDCILILGKSDPYYV